MSSVAIAITRPISTTPRHMRASMARSVGRRGGRAITSSVSGSTPIASAGPESVTRLIQRICVASSGSTSRRRRRRGRSRRRRRRRGRRSAPRPCSTTAGSAGTCGCCRRCARPSRTASTMVAKLSSARIILAASLATSVPVMPIATPMSAAFSAGASLTPSPVIATTLPSACSASTMRSLCAGATRAYTDVLRTAAAKAGGVERVELGAGQRLRARARRCRGRRRCAPPCAGGRR